MNNQTNLNQAPASAHSEQMMTALINEASAILLATMERYGNVMTPLHIEALRQLLTELTLIAFGKKQGRYAYPLPTGMGKTESVVAWCTALANLNFTNISVVVSATKVEALAGLKGKMMANGVPEAMIGLIHSYRHDPKLEGDLPENYASLPSTDENDDRQIMLVTHSRIKTGKLDRYNQYKGQPRDLVIWDESLLISKSRFISSQSLKKSFGHLLPDLPDTSKAVKFFDQVFIALDSALARQQSGSAPARLVLPQLDENAAFAIRREIGDGLVEEPLRMLLEMASEPLRVIDAQKGDAVVAYDIVVPVELKSIAILDASYPIRELERLDKTIQLGCLFDPALKRYDNVRLHHLKSASGRESVTKSFRQQRREDRKISMEVCDLIARLPKDEGVIIYTFKTRAVAMGTKTNPDFKNILSADLKAHGINVDCQLPEGRRVVMLTWGQETSLSQYSYCQHVIFAGVLHRDYTQIASEVLGQSDNLCHALPKSTVSQMMDSEIAHGLYQAASRGSCRKVVGNQAQRMDIWLIHGNEKIRPLLEQAMPGLEWLAWKPLHLVKATKHQLAVKAFTDYLDQIPFNVSRIATRTLYKDVKVDLAPTFRTDALKQALEEFEGWSLEGRSVVRKEPDYALLFQKAA